MLMPYPGGHPPFMPNGFGQPFASAPQMYQQTATLPMASVPQLPYPPPLAGPQTPSWMPAPAAPAAPQALGFAAAPPASLPGGAGAWSAPGAGRPAEPVVSVSDKDRAIMHEAGKIFEAIDVESQGSISKLHLLDAVHQNIKVDDFVLPDIDSGHASSNPAQFDAVDSMFDAISGGRRRIRKHTFVRYFRKASAGAAIAKAEIQRCFEEIDTRRAGSFSRLALLEAVRKNTAVAELLQPGEDCSDIFNNAHRFDAVDSIFDAIAGGKPRATFEDFDTYVHIHHASDHRAERSSKRVLVIGPGFRDANPQLRAALEQESYQIQWVSDSSATVDQIKASIDSFRPHLVACASVGGCYVEGLWRTGSWRGPTLMINVHPSITELPRNVPVVIAHGSNDTQYRRSRDSLEQLVASGTANMCFLYYSAGAGRSSSNPLSRAGDTHAMESLLRYDLLPRLMDAAMSGQSPESHMLWSCSHRLPRQRLDAERWLSYCPDTLRRYWVSTGHKGQDRQKLYKLAPNSEEFSAVATIFSAAPPEAPSCCGAAAGLWERTQLLGVERVENGLLEGGCAGPYYEALERCIEEQGVPFEAGLHTRWGFHGSEAVESIVSDPLSGFQPLASPGSLWGSGTYFARDARCAVESNSCPLYQDGTRKLLLCLLMTGIPCLGDPEQRGVLPFRQRPHRYNCAVDSLSSPETFVLHHPGAAYPAYLITYCALEGQCT